MFYVRTPRAEFLVSLRPMGSRRAWPNPSTVEHEAPRISMREMLQASGVFTLIGAAVVAIAFGLTAWACL